MMEPYEHMRSRGVRSIMILLGASMWTINEPHESAEPASGGWKCYSMCLGYCGVHSTECSLRAREGDTSS